MNNPAPPAAGDPPRLAVMLSGTGRTLLNLLAAIDRGELHARVALVIASRECLGAQRSRDAGLTTRVLPGDLSAETLNAELASRQIDLVALSGYLRMIRIPSAFEHSIVNIHPALLPSFGGPGMYGDRVHAAVLAAGCKVSGCTAHFVDAEYDRGPIIAQEAVPVLEGDDIHALGARVFAAECRLYPRALQLVLARRVRLDGRIVRILPESPDTPRHESHST